MPYPPYQGYNNFGYSPPTRMPIFAWVKGIEGAYAYQMGPGQTAYLFDTEQDTFYVKTTDAANYPTVRTFDFTERIQVPVTSNTAEYATKDDLTDLYNKILEAVNAQQSVSTVQSATAKSNNSNNRSSQSNVKR